jgi:hypothetical protein
MSGDALIWRPGVPQWMFRRDKLTRPAATVVLIKDANPRPGRLQFDWFAHKQPFQLVTPDFITRETDFQRAALLMLGAMARQPSAPSLDSYRSCVCGLALMVWRSAVLVQNCQRVIWRRKMWRSLSLAGLGLTMLSLNAAAQPGSPPQQSTNADDQQRADQYGQADMSCRRSAATRSGYHASDQATAAAASSKVQQRYAAAYYACMSGENGAPPPPPDSYGYAYGPPPPNGYGSPPSPNGYGPDAYGYGQPPPNGYGPDGYDYGPPPPPHYYADGPYPYSYPYPPYYPPYYYGPAVTFGFGFGGFHGGHGGGHRWD